ncbi:MAG: hypothetical protein N2C14_25805, partial [Planctomycetales bacterium]
PRLGNFPAECGPTPLVIVTVAATVASDGISRPHASGKSARFARFACLAQFCELCSNDRGIIHRPLAVECRH